MILIKKALRSMLDNKGAYIACIVLIAVGVMIYGAMGIAATSLSVSKDNYYKEYRLADVFAKVAAIPESKIDSLSDIEGIDQALGRMVSDARVMIEGNEKIVTLRLISTDENRDDQLNSYKFEGKDFYSQNDIKIGADFMKANNLKTGDSLNLIINGKETTVTICASVSSPEYVYAIKNAKELLPDPETFSIGFVRQEYLFAVTGNEGIYNDLSFKLSEGYTFDDVKILLEDALNKYGLTELIPQKDQISVNMLNMEIDGVNSYATSLPVVFVSMAIVILYLMLKRVIEQDRTQIGTLKAFGYSSGEILLHYMIYGGITGFLGGVLGDLMGYGLSGYMMNIYLQFFNLPGMGVTDVGTYMAGGMSLALGGGLFGALMGALSILKLNPADAMRPAAPKAVKHDLLKYLPFLKWILNSRGSMAVRNIQRNKIRSLFVIIGVMFSFALMALMASYDYMIDSMMLDQFNKIQIYEAKAVLEKPMPYEWALKSVSDIEGVTYAEGIMEMPVELVNGHRRRGIMITGLEQNSSLYKVYDSEKRLNKKLPEGGVLISNALAEKLEAKRGDYIYISSPLLDKDVKVIVDDVVTQNLGSSSYMDMDELARIFNTSRIVTSVIFNTSDLSEVKRTLTDGKNVAVIEDKAGMAKKNNEMIEPYMSMIYIFEIFAGIVAFAIIYNTSSISLSERKREYATLRVLGLQVGEVSEIMSFEYWILSFIGMMCGIPLTRWLKQALAGVMDAESISFPIYTPPLSYVVAVLCCVTAVFVSLKAASRSIKKFDMVEVLKERE